MKNRRLSSSPRVNKQASTPFELVHSNVLGVHVQLCSQLGFDTLSFLLMIIHEPLGYI